MVLGREIVSIIVLIRLMNEGELGTFPYCIG